MSGNDDLTIVIPSMRPRRVALVVEDLLAQTKVPEKILVVDNSCSIDTSKAPFTAANVQVLCFGDNVGTNAVWNIMWDMDTDFVGFSSDDLRLDPNMCNKLVSRLRLPDAKYPKRKFAAACPTIRHFLPLPKSQPGNLNYCIERAKGNAAAAILRRECLVKIPKIPKQFRIFFGDNWMGYHLAALNYKWIRVGDCYIYHKHWTDDPPKLAQRLDYKKVIWQERGYWKHYIRELAKEGQAGSGSVDV